MLLAYLTTDEVNQRLAVEMAEECGITLDPQRFTEVPSIRRFDAVLYDWNSLVSFQQEEVLKDSLATLPSCPLAVHGYGLEEDTVESLRQDGVAVFDHLDLEAFKTLRRLTKTTSRPPPRKQRRRRITAHFAYRLVPRPRREFHGRMPGLPGGIKSSALPDRSSTDSCSQEACTCSFTVFLECSEKSPFHCDRPAAEQLHELN
jgi:hypothetical protein